MVRHFKQSLRLSLVAAIVLAVPVAQAQNYDGYPAWEPMPQMDNYGSPDGFPWQPPVEQNSPADLLRDGVQKLTRFLDSKPNPRALSAYINQAVVPWFDFEYMASWAAGRRFRMMDGAQRAELAGRIKSSFLEKMTQKLARYSQQRATFLPAEPDGFGQVTLPISIENPGGGYPAHLEFVMRQTGQGWKVVDVSANGMSALVYYRQMLSEVQRPAQYARQY